MIQRFKKLAPQPLKQLIYKFLKLKVFCSVYYRDAKRFLSHSSMVSHRGRKENLRSLIAIDYHRLEKGLALPNPKPAFGVAIVDRLVDLLMDYLSKHGPDWTIKDAVLSLNAYFERYGEDAKLLKARERFEIILGEAYPDGINQKVDAISFLSKEDHQKTLDFDFASFYHSRHSIREFSDEPVCDDLVRSSIQLAMRAPSVCNRQPWKVYSLSKSEKISKLCQIQGGSRGFADQISRLLVVAVDLSEFYMVGERNECWVDGGIFLQSLLVCLHANGLGACPLNWCVSTAVDEEARSLLGADPGHNIIALIAVGSLKDHIKFARSERRPVDDVLINVE